MAGSSGQSPSRATVKRHLQAMDDERFEHFVADLWSREGWQTTVSRQSRDKSLDVLAEKAAPYHQRHAIQAKRYRDGNNVGGPKISEYASLRDQFDADAAVVVTTSGFTRDARERAATLNVKLVDGDDLVDMVARADALDLIAQYSEHTSRRGGSDAEGRRASDPRQVASEEYLWLGLAVLGAIPATAAALSVSVFDVGTGTLFGQLLNAVLVVSASATAASIYKDTLLVRRARVGWQPSVKWWTAGALFVPYLAVPMYALRRYEAVHH